MRLTRTFPRWLSFIISPTFVTGPTRHSRENTIETRVAKLLYIHPNSTAVNRTPELCRVSLQISCFCFPDVPTQTRHSSPLTHLVHLPEGHTLILVYPLSSFWKMIIRWNFLSPQHEPAALYRPSGCGGWFPLVGALLLTFKGIFSNLHPSFFMLSHYLFPVAFSTSVKCVLVSSQLIVKTSRGMSTCPGVW